MSFSDFYVKELAKAGTLFLVMGGFLYIQRSDYKELSVKLEVYRKETKQCTDEYQKALANQLGRSSETLQDAKRSIDKNNELINKIILKK